MAAKRSAVWQAQPSVNGSLAQDIRIARPRELAHIFRISNSVVRPYAKGPVSRRPEDSERDRMTSSPMQPLQLIRVNRQGRGVGSVVDPSSSKAKVVYPAGNEAL